MKIKSPQKMHQKIQPGQKIQLFNLLGDGKSQTSKSVMQKAKKYLQGREKRAFNADDWNLDSPGTYFDWAAQINPYDLFGGASHEDLVDFDRRGQALARRGFDPEILRQRAETLRSIAESAGDPQMGGVPGWLQRTFRPTAFIGGGQAADTAYGNAIRDLARRLEESGQDPERATLLAQQLIGDRGQFNRAATDALYQHGNMWQQQFTPMDDLLDSRARALATGTPGGSNFALGIYGGLRDYLAGNLGETRTQEAAREITRQDLQEARRQAEQQLGQPIHTTSEGWARDENELRRQWAQRNLGRQQLGSQESQNLQAEGQTADWQRGRGLLGLLPWLGAGTGEGSRLERDLGYAQRGEWGDLSKITTGVKRLGNYLTGDVYSGHGKMMDTNSAYRALADRAQGGQMSLFDDYSPLLAEQEGEARWKYSPMRLIDWDDRAGNTEGVNFLKGYQNSPQARLQMQQLRMGYYTPEQVQQIEKSFAGASPWQRKAMGLDEALTAAKSQKTQQSGAAMINLGQHAREYAQKQRPPAPTPSVPAPAPSGGAPAANAQKDAQGSSANSYKVGWAKRAFAGGGAPITPLAPQWGNAAFGTRPTTPYRATDQAAPPAVPPAQAPTFEATGTPNRLRNLQQSQYRWQQFHPNVEASPWAHQGGNPFRSYSRDNPYRQDPVLDMPISQSLPYDVASLFMSEEDLAKFDPAKVRARALLRSGNWQPGMRVDDLAQGGGWRAIGGLTDWLGITRSPMMDARDLRASQMGSQAFRQLEREYAEGRLSPRQFQQLSGSPIRELYLNAPERFKALSNEASSARARLKVDSLLQKAQNERQRVLGDAWEASMLT